MQVRSCSATPWKNKTRENIFFQNTLTLDKVEKTLSQQLFAYMKMARPKAGR